MILYFSNKNFEFDKWKKNPYRNNYLFLEDFSENMKVYTYSAGFRFRQEHHGGSYKLYGIKSFLLLNDLVYLISWLPENEEQIGNSAKFHNLTPSFHIIKTCEEGLSYLTSERLNGVEMTEIQV